MAVYKNHHYVPRCLMKPFSVDGDGKSIHLFNINRERSIQNAAVKGQCSKNYLYGDDPELENRIGDLERLYSNVRNRLLKNDFDISADERITLIYFILLQYCRTEAAVRRLLEVSNQHVSDFGVEEARKTEYEMMMISLGVFVNSISTIGEFKVCIIYNSSSLKFVVSDDPAVMVSRFQNVKMKKTTFGLGGAGISIFLPISPDLCLLCYDSDIYHIPSIKGGKVHISKEREAQSINQLQYIRGTNNVYFSDWSEHEVIVKSFNEYKHLRKDSWAQFMYFKEVKDNSIQNLEKYVRIEGPQDLDIKNGDVGLTTVMIHQAEPNNWPTFLKFRNRFRYYNNGSAIGAVRLSVAKEKAKLDREGL